MKEESQIDGQEQPVPLAIGHLEIAEVLNPPGDALVFGLAREQDGARIARTDDPPVRKFDQVLMLGREACAAHLAPLGRLRPAYKTFERREGGGWSGTDHSATFSGRE